MKIPDVQLSTITTPRLQRKVTIICTNSVASVEMNKKVTIVLLYVSVQLFGFTVKIQTHK